MITGHAAEQTLLEADNSNFLISANSVVLLSIIFLRDLHTVRHLLVSLMAMGSIITVLGAMPFIITADYYFQVINLHLNSMNKI